MTSTTTAADPAATEDAEIRDVPLVSVGGGLGSFALVDRLRIGGVPAEDIAVVTTEPHPADTFERACRTSGMEPEDRLRSDSASRVDNIWGFPGYSLSEARARRSLAPVWQALGEPLLSQPYTPMLRTMIDGIDREADRIGWEDLTIRGYALNAVELPEGGYAVLVRRPQQRDLLLRCRHLHLALGSAGPRISGELAAYRTRGGGADAAHCYEPHEEIYQQLRRSGGSVMVRGSGIAASRVIQRLIDDHDEHGHDLHIWQVFRHYQAAPTGPRTARPDAAHGYLHQPFSYPKAAFTGQLRDTTRRLAPEDRAETARRLGVTSTPYRKLWAEQLSRARTEGWYDAVAGDVARLRTLPGEAEAAERIRADVRLADGKVLALDTDFVIEATGMETGALRHPLVADLAARGLVGVTDLDGVAVDGHFIAGGTENGLIFASGMTARGAPLAPVDSFLGLQSAALSITDVLAKAGYGRRLGPARSVAQWFKWMGGHSL